MTGGKKGQNSARMPFMSTADDRQAFLASLAADPFDIARRLAYADWLEEHNQTAEAQVQRIQGNLIRDLKGRHTLFGRSGAFPEPAPDWESRPADRQASLKSRIGKLFDERPWLQFVVVTPASPEECGFRPVAQSPVVHWHLPNDQIRDVLPAALPAAQDAQVVEFVRRCADAAALVPASGPASKGFGEHSRPEWDVKE
jgi:uncharacterized protein (TIGR02996 family)